MTNLKIKLPTFKKVEKALERDDMTGFCLSCGKTRGDTESDAKRYPCPGCGQSMVFGAGYILEAGHFKQ